MSEQQDMTDVELVEYVKSHVQMDLDDNKREFGRSLYFEISKILSAYLLAPTMEKTLDWTMFSTIPRLQESVERKYGIIPTFLETTKCGFVIRELARRKSETYLEELESYAKGLVEIGVQEEFGG